MQIPRAVYNEVVVKGLKRGAPDALSVRLFWRRQGWPIVTVSSDALSAYTPMVTLDPGEIEVLALAQRSADVLVLLDDEIARAEARRLGLRLRGTLGIIVQAYRQDLLGLRQVELLLDEIANRSDIWISAKLCGQVLRSLYGARE